MLTPLLAIHLIMLTQLGPDPVAACDSQKETCNDACPRPGNPDRESCRDACTTQRDNCLALILNPQLKITPPANLPVVTPPPPVKPEPKPAPPAAKPVVNPPVQAEPPPKPVKRKATAAKPRPKPAEPVAPVEPSSDSASVSIGSEASARPGRFPLLDIGVTGGLNNPGGIYGGELTFFLWPELAIGVAGGNGAWGPRVTPKLQIFPFASADVGFFIEGGVDLNLGGYSVLKGTNGTVYQTVDQLFTPAANATLGWRIALGPRFWVAARGGWSFPFRATNVSVRGGGSINPLLAAPIALAQPGGFVVGGSVGVALGDGAVFGGGDGYQREPPSSKPRSMDLIPPHM